MAKVEQVELMVQDKAIHCAACESRIENTLKKLPGIESVKADHKTQTVQLALDSQRVTVDTIRKKLASIGCETAT